MTIWSALYKLLIGPLELLFEVIYAIANRVVHHPGLAIIFLSLAMNFLVLPLYRRADIMQEEERDREARMKPWVDHIKKTFHGDERFMMLQTFYRQNDYKPSYALKGSFSLLLEIPFFIAAYRFLSGLQLLQGVAFGPIRDLGAPDALITIAGISVNLLPILMTAVNAVSAAIYMKGFPLKSKIQMYGMALIFLVFLYTSPAGLVFYWTLNNVFSLVKNIFYKLKDPKKILRIGASVIGLILLAVVLVRHPFDSRRKTIIAVAAILMLQLPLLIGLLSRGRTSRRAIPEATKTDDRLFLLGCVFMTLLTGVLIPSAVLKASPTEFVNIMAYRSPLWYVASATLIAAGTFIIWFGIFYKLAAPSGKKIMGLLMWILSVCAAVNYMFFGTERGDMSDQLVYDNLPVDTARDYLINLAVLLAIAALLYLLWKKKEVLVNVAILTLCLATGAMSVINITTIHRDLAEVRDNIAEAAEEMPSFSLSKNGQNVIVFMLDRDIGYYVPFLMAEKPELIEQFDGFTFYPNTISFGDYTNAGAAPIFGGYEYTPEEMNKRSDELLVDKHNEALKVMPVLFDEAGYSVTVCDPPYAGYKGTPPDIHIYDEYPSISKYVTQGKYVVPELENTVINTRNRNFFCFSLYKIAPLVLQPTLYTQGMYNEADALAGQKEDIAAQQTVSDDLLYATGTSSVFQNAYGVLCNLAEITNIRDDDENTFLMIDNDTTHSPLLLQLPDYTPSGIVDNHGLDPLTRTSLLGDTIEFTSARQITHYHADMAAFLQIGKWLDYMRENGVYDNTRIIFVADHGYSQYYPGHRIGSEWYEDVLCFNPVLMVKDFGATGELTIDNQFMTNADVPTIAMSDLIDDPVNPFTGLAINSDAKDAPYQVVHHVIEWDTRKNNGTTFLPGVWFSVHDDLFNTDNWEKLGEY